MANKDVKTKLIGFQAIHDKNTGFTLTNPRDPNRCSFGSADYVNIANINVTSVICSRCGNKVQIVRTAEMVVGNDT